jgi:Protein of unknown function (Porph_ging).
MRIIFFFVPLFICSTVILAQNKGSENNIEPKFKCIYIARYVKDTISMTQGTEDRFILNIGDSFSFGHSYLSYFGDSLQKANLTLWIDRITNAAKSGTVSTLYGWIKKAQLYKDYKEKKITVRDNISSYSYNYEDSLNSQTWMIEEDTMTIAGYLCQKAVCDWRGRSYEAWFTAEIPVSEGPWKFYGLPGLILSLYDTKRHYEFELIEFKNTDQKINLESFTSRPFRLSGKKIERKEFLSVKYGKRGELIVSSEMAKIGLTYKPVSRNYNYIELDY